MSVESDRLPICQSKQLPTIQEERPSGGNANDGAEELRLWSLNVRSISTEAKLKELEQDASQSRSGILLVQETWRNCAAERISIGNWVFYGTGDVQKPKGNGTGVMVHKSIQVESWHYVSPRITAVRIARGGNTI